MVAETQPAMPTVDDFFARRIRLEEALEELMANMDSASDNLGFVCETLRHDRDAWRLLDDLRGINSRIVEFAGRPSRRGAD